MRVLGCLGPSTFDRLTIVSRQGWQSFCLSLIHWEVYACFLVHLFYHTWPWSILTFHFRTLEVNKVSLSLSLPWSKTTIKAISNSWKRLIVFCTSWEKIAVYSHLFCIQFSFSWTSSSMSWWSHNKRDICKLWVYVSNKRLLIFTMLLCVNIITCRKSPFFLSPKICSFGPIIKYRRNKLKIIINGGHLSVVRPVVAH